ncbi:hypothetical protein BDZ85DRAFT_247477 [Elsinoe ampelina]|uniref:NAD(P)-binding protein n=1 Tax=Elsinoe ampelina TaxID=302913 RepID=A0A6A6GIB1_9PEZI|nr:hypothetical protein BDZ85DRAFT_247477 [Elsinoe ampelina]
MASTPSDELRFGLTLLKPLETGIELAMVKYRGHDRLSAQQVASKSGYKLLIGCFQSIDEFVDDAFMYGFSLNIIKEEIRTMKDFPGEKTIVNIASIAADTHGGQVYAYSTSKAAVKYFTQSLAKELVPLNIRVNDIQPGPIDTPMLKHFLPKAAGANPMAGMQTGTADDVGHTATWMLSEALRM